MKHSDRKLYLGILHISKQNSIELRDQKKNPNQTQTSGMLFHSYFVSQWEENDRWKYKACLLPSDL